MKIPILILFLLGISLSGLSSPACASDFKTWVNHFRTEAIQKGVRPEVFDEAFKDAQPNQRVVELDRKQPELTKTGFTSYLSRVLHQRRIDEGRHQFRQNGAILQKVSAQYAVPAEVVIALWGVETTYGKNTGGFDLVMALATLAWEGRRADFFKTELIQALLILQAGHIDRANFKGSWAGAMGQNQFMPSSWHKFAVDFNGDGHKDIWKTRADIFASTANYLHMNGWDQHLKWGWQIQRASHLSNLDVLNKHAKSYADWLRMGIKFKHKLPSISADTPLTLIIPDGGDGRAYLVTKNFDVIKTWNRSNYFALTVGILSDLVLLNEDGSSPYLSDTNLNQ